MPLALKGSKLTHAVLGTSNCLDTEVLCPQCRIWTCSSTCEARLGNQRHFSKCAANRIGPTPLRGSTNLSTSATAKLRRGPPQAETAILKRPRLLAAEVCKHIISGTSPTWIGPTAPIGTEPLAMETGLPKLHRCILSRASHGTRRTSPRPCAPCASTARHEPSSEARTLEAEGSKRQCTPAEARRWWHGQEDNSPSAVAWRQRLPSRVEILPAPPS
mmetsp:Transcript_119526/g.298099  ORF Transcript_119526/g.298099 Transcript_119526/m.298099 type:complete len:217 (+) Transcript_119526:469-1119(+)